VIAPIQCGASRHKIISILALLLYKFFEKLKLKVIILKKEMTHISKIPLLNARHKVPPLHWL
jgi:hypothetical protein